MNPPSATLPPFELNGGRCEVFPLGRNSDGLHTSAFVVGTATNPSGAPGIPGVSASVPSTPSIPQLTSNGNVPGNFSIGIQTRIAQYRNFEIRCDPSGLGVDMVCRPFDPQFLGKLPNWRERVFWGRQIRQRIFRTQFIKDGATSAPVLNEDSALVVYAILTERSDFPAATIDLMIANAAYDPTDNVLPLGFDPSAQAYVPGTHPTDENRESDGPFFFGEMSYDTSAPGLDHVILEPRAGSFSRTNADSGFIVEPARQDLVGDEKSPLNALFPGAYFVRRLCIFDAASMNVAGSTAVDIANDIVERRDFGWAVGSLGYQSGGYTEGQWAAPDLSFFNYAGKSDWAAVVERGAKYLIDARNELASTLVDLGNGGPSEAFAGWFRPISSPSHDPTAEKDVEFSGYTWPSNGEMLGRLLLGDTYMERDHMALVNTQTGRPLNDTEYVTQGGGKFPTGFNAGGVTWASIVPQHNIPKLASSGSCTAGSTGIWCNPGTYTGGNRLETATLSLPWNSPGANEECPFLRPYTWVQSYYYTPLGYSHSSKPMSHWRSTAWGLNDTLTWLAIEFRTNSYSFAKGRFDVYTAGSAQQNRNRSQFYRTESNLYAFKNDTINSTPPVSGIWAKANGTSFHKDGTPRTLINGLAFFAAHYCHADDSERLRWQSNAPNPANTGPGAQDHDVRLLIGTFYGTVATLAGVMCTHDENVGGPPVYTGYASTNLALKTGAVPGGAFSNPVQSEHWAATRIYQQAYAVGAMQGLANSVMPTVANTGDAIDDRYIEDGLNRIHEYPDNWAAAAINSGCAAPLTSAPSGPDYAIFSVIAPTNRGTSGVSNPFTSKAQMRAGDLFWHGVTLDQPGQWYREHFAMYAGWSHRALGNWGELLNGIALNYGIDPTGQTEAQLRAAIRPVLEERFEFFSANFAGWERANHLAQILSVI